MKPVNNKSLVHFLYQTMEDLSNKKVSKEDALAQVQIAKQINSHMRYELERAKTVMQLAEHNARFKDGTNLREIESKNFQES